MGEERIKSEEELKKDQDPLSQEQLEEVAGGTGESLNKCYHEEKQK